MEISFSGRFLWDSRGELPKSPGVYVINKASAGGVIYIGLTAGKGGLRGRLRKFHRSATKGMKGHAGGLTFFRVFSGDVSDLSVRVHAVEQFGHDPIFMSAYVAHVERRLFWEHIEVHGRLPVCNAL